jgi:hypothetical protein
MKLYIKYMVSHCCKLMVKEEFRKLGLKAYNIELGEVEVDGEISPELFEKIKDALLKQGHELMEDKKSIQIEKIKNVIIEMIHFSDEPLEITYISNLFSEVTGVTIQQFIITHKIERVKELIIYNELSLKEIAYKLHYSSVGHLSNQFKKITGLSPIFYKSLKQKRRISLESVLIAVPVSETV